MIEFYYDYRRSPTKSKVSRVPATEGMGWRKYVPGPDWFCSGITMAESEKHIDLTACVKTKTPPKS